MKGRILVLGAAGRLGFVAAEAFRDAGWQVKGLVRPGRAGAVPRRIEAIEAVTRDEAVAAAQRLRRRAQRAQSGDHRMAEERAVARLCGDRGGREQRRDAAVSRQRLELRRAACRRCSTRARRCSPPRARAPCASRSSSASSEACDRGMRAIILRAGDFFGGGSGSWFDLVIAKDIARSRLTYPGPARRRACLGLPARFRGDDGAARGAARELRRLRDVRISRPCA